MERRLSKELQIDIKCNLKNFNDFESAEDFDFDQVDLLKGETPPDIKGKCLKICQNYLSGIWCQQSLETIKVERVSGGLTNQLYYCSIKDGSIEGLEPKEVAIRLYGPKYFDSCDNESNERLSDVIIGLIVSENNLGPKIYGIFDEGQIQQYYKHRQFREDEQKNLKNLKQVAQSLARIHSMNVPIKKNTDWLLKMSDTFLATARSRHPLKDEMDEYNCVTLKNENLDEELKWMKQVVLETNSPIVFTHNDFRSSNLMITEPNDQLVVCDFEYAGYGYRGHDFVAFAREWGRNPFDFKSIVGLPPKDEEFGPFVEIYVKESVKIFGESYSQNTINSVENILKEIKIFLLNSQLFGVIFLMKNDETNGELPFNRKISMGLAEIAFKNYFTLKNDLIDRKVIKFNE